MHRSGTSVATRLINLLGVSTCVEEDLLDGPGNPTGHWESASLTSLNERVLHQLGCDWSCPPRLAAGWQRRAALDGLREEADELFPRVMPDEQWVWKDPRNCLLLPFWMERVDVRPVVVLVYRNPLEVAASLQARDGHGKVHALALWERYVRQSLAETRGLAALVTSYERLLEAPLEWCEEMRELLGDLGVRTDPPSQRDVQAYVEAGLRHQELPAEAIGHDADVSAAQRALYAALESLDGRHDALLPPALPPETPSTEAVLEERRNASHLQRELDALQTQLQAAQTAHEERLSSLTRETEDLAEALAAVESEKAGLADLLTALTRSRSYRYTAPARAIHAWAHGLLRRGAT
jgi:hypothetical protein